MKALTVCQPYASLIIGWPGIDAEDVKRVENRGRYFSYRGPLLVHAGKSTNFLKTTEGEFFGETVPRPMPMGAIVGSVDVVDFRHIKAVQALKESDPLAWILDHIHATGPWCIILRRPRRLIDPIPFRGQQGLFDVPDELLAGVAWEPQCRVCRCTELDACEGGCYWVQPKLCSACAEKTDRESANSACRGAK